MPRFLLPVFLSLMAMPVMAQDRPPIAMPGPSIAPSAPAQPSAPALSEDILALSMAVEASGCILHPRNSAAILAQVGMTPEEGIIARQALVRSGLASPHPASGGIAMNACLQARTPAAPAGEQPTPPTQLVASELVVDELVVQDDIVEEKEPLTLLQRRRCEDRPNLSFCD